MRRNYITVILLLVMLVGISPVQAEDQPPDSATRDYIIGPGDLLDISVWNNDALTKSVIVLPDGKIHYPLIGEVVVGGKTLAVLEKELEDKINAFEPNPELSVMVSQVNSLVIYIIGKVNSPGKFALNTNINVLQALATAGGLNTFAKKNKIKIYRETNGKTEIFPFDYDEVIDGKNLEQNIRLERGDIIVIP